jgi:hypothetical protein
LGPWRLRPLETAVWLGAFLFLAGVLTLVARAVLLQWERRTSSSEESMFFADDVSFSVAGIAIITTLLGAVAGALVIIFRLLMAAKDQQIADIKEQRESYKKVAERTVATLEQVSNQKVIDGGGVPIPKIAPIVPESNSPTTPSQQFSADLETLKARQLVASLVLLPPVKAAEAGEKEVDLTIEAQTIRATKPKE